MCKLTMNKKKDLQAQLKIAGFTTISKLENTTFLTQTIR